ncbi:MAG TPA: hypothetical protein VHC49_05250 [Mycobacteriales bacterium]|nr:hypothetical protein [Mycobacteriales bacterium]
MGIENIDEALHCGRRGLRTRPGSLLLGPTGARLWADYLDEVPGFQGQIDLVHKANIPLLFAVLPQLPATAPPAAVEWRPSLLTVDQDWNGLRLHERKFISWDDRAVSLQSWTNSRAEAVELRLGIDDTWMQRAEFLASGERELPGRGGLRVRMAVAGSDPRLWTGIRLAPGESYDVIVAAALGLDETDSFEQLTERVVETCRSGDLEQIAARQSAEYATWFSAAPSFTSSDPLLDRTWNYRWFLLRHNLARPGYGQLPEITMWEGRSHKMTKEPWNPGGWEFSKLIPLSSPLQLLDARWHADPDLGAGILRSAAATQDSDGLLHATTVDGTFSHYCNFLGFAAARYADVHGTERIQAALSVLKKQVQDERTLRAPGDDGLPVQPVHQLTGKEYQPSYWYFHDFPDDPKDPATYTPLKRVDQAIYQYLNAIGVAELCERLGDADGVEFRAIAAEIAHSILTKQWDEETDFFYDLHHRTDEKAMVRNVVGLYPWWAGITGAEHLPGLERAFTADAFGSPWPLPSVSVDSPAFAPAGGWNGQFLKGRNGCMWNGPTWPYTNSIALDAVGRQTLAHGHRYDGLFADLLHKFCLLHFHGHDGRTPYLVEHYDSLTGEPISDESDYLHSYLIDLVIRYVAGLRIEGGSIVVEPVDIGLDHFELSDVPVGGHRVTVTYRRGGDTRLIVDGTEIGGALIFPLV